MILNPFKDKNILITGGSRGIGLEMAKELARNGANLALIARGKDDLQAAASAIEALGTGTRVRTYACDVTKAEALADVINMACFELGSLDGVIANSGYCHPGNFLELDLDDFNRQIDVNLRGVIHTVHHALPHLLENEHGGFVAITSSPAGRAGIYGFSAYGPTKAALINLADTLRYEFADRGIRVHTLLPPDTDTPGYQEEIKLYPPETHAILAGGKLLSPETVAKRCLLGIANQKKNVLIGAEARFLLLALRYAPGLWDAYVAHKKRQARKHLARNAPANESAANEAAANDAAANDTAIEDAATQHQQPPADPSTDEQEKSERETA